RIGPGKFAHLRGHFAAVVAEVALFGLIRGAAARGTLAARRARFATGSGARLAPRTGAHAAEASRVLGVPCAAAAIATEARTLAAEATEAAVAVIAAFAAHGGRGADGRAKAKEKSRGESGEFHRLPTIGIIPRG